MEFDYPCFVYVLGSVSGEVARTYVGWTTDVEKRLAAHNAGTGAKSTRGRMWVILHTEEFKTRGEAMSREWHLKRDRKFRKKLMDTHLGTS
ncbi:GIY-YIG nuclease family protein [Kordiimonas aestuarii]|uniref:GIY-YIG nuclease family protein n=1 Tax=Kordiimonas aestuarii TaxID=1005925 RepID=UPI0021D0B37F|nr:GIY-YIG nuclease family protein [Kordiimonas aestuarii]